ncbi:transposase-like protein [Escherichia coli]|nr:transposase-like protein [Escherichia coli]
MLPSETMIWQPEFTDKTLSRKPGAVHEDLSQFDRLLKKLSVEAALNAEMTHHPGYEKNQPRPGANSRNGYSTKTVITGDGPLELRTPRDRDGTFEPQLVKKNQTCITGMDNQILSLYAKGMTPVR